MKPYQHFVQYYETDRMGITHHSNYIRIMEEARSDYLRQLGFGYERLEEMGIVSPVVSIQCDYKKPTTYADTIEVHLTLLELGAVKLRMGYTMLCRGEVVLTGVSAHGFLNREGKPISIKRQYPEFYQALSAQKTE